MKLILALILALHFPKIALSHDHPSVHGMLILGQSKIYLSHLPMFHSPHDYQVIIEAEISAESKQAYFTSLENSSELVYTLVPEAFVLPDMLKNPKTFKEKIYKGHFERGGELIASNALIEIKKIVYFKKFNSIETKPDFDMILKVESSHELSGSSVEVVIDSVKNIEPLIAGEIYETKDLPVEVKTVIYYENGDLSF
jgi:hypothetical protein